MLKGRSASGVSSSVFYHSFRLGRMNPKKKKKPCNKHNGSFSFTGKEQYIHCLSGICRDRRAAGSKMQRREAK